MENPVTVFSKSPGLLWGNLRGHALRHLLPLGAHRRHGHLHHTPGDAPRRGGLRAQRAVVERHGRNKNAGSWWFLLGEEMIEMGVFLGKMMGFMIWVLYSFFLSLFLLYDLT